MKKIILFLIIVFVLLILITISSDVGKILIANNDITIINETGRKIPVNVYNRTGKEKGLILVFDINDLTPFPVLLIFPEYNIIGLPNGGKNDYVKLTNKYGYQRKKSFDSFKILYHGGKEGYYNIDYPNEKAIIKNISFTKGQIVFDAYGKLKSYGNQVIIKNIK